MVFVKIVLNTNDLKVSSVDMTSAQSGKRCCQMAHASIVQLERRQTPYTPVVQVNAIPGRNFSMMAAVKIVHCIQDSELIRMLVDQIYAETER